MVEKKSSSENTRRKKKSESKEKKLQVNLNCSYWSMFSNYLATALTKFCLDFWTLACNFPCFFSLIYLSLNKASLKQHSGSLVVQNLAEAGLKANRYAPALLYFNSNLVYPHFFTPSAVRDRKQCYNFLIKS